MALRALPAVLFAVLLGLAATTANARPCATVQLREALRRGTLPVSSMALQTRPPSVGFLDSETLPVRVHWETEAVAVRAPLVLSLVEEAWARLVTEMGFPAPLPDRGEGGDERFDVYIGFVAPAAALTIAGEDVSDSDGRAASYAYMHLSATLDENQLPTFVHHEMAHVVQFALDLKESLMFAEASAVAYERLALPEVDAWADRLEDFQSFPELPLFTNGIDARAHTVDDTLYEQGAALFLLYLEQEHGDFDGTLIRRLWEASAQELPPPDAGLLDENEPDWLDALPDVTGAPLEELVLDFATWRVLLAGWAVPDDGLVGGESLSGRALLGTTRLVPQSLDGRPSALGRGRSPHQLGCAAFEVQAVGKELSLAVEVESLPREDGEEPRPLGAAWVLGNPSEDRATRARLEEIGPSLAFSLEVSAGDTLVLSLCDVGEADADELPRATEVVLSLHNEAVPRFDPGPPEDDAGPPADAGSPAEDAGMVCACQHVPTPRSTGAKGGPFDAIRPYAVGAMSVIGLLLLFVRGRRVIRRRKLYRDDAARAQRASRAERR